MTDKIEKIGKDSIIQHGKLNDRIYLMKLGKEDFPQFLDTLRKIARDHHYTKIFCKVPGPAAPYFFSDGYLTEAYIPGFYRSGEPVFFLSKFLDSDRLMGVENESLAELGKLLSTHNSNGQKEEKKGTRILTRELNHSHVEQITALYREVFASYPFPIHHSDYIQETMLDNVNYYGIEEKGQIVAVASAEMDPEGGSAEMTDFATLPEFRGKKLAQKLLSRMEKEMKAQDIHTLFTIARLNSIPMNKTFLKNRYHYAGTLIRNTNIAGKIESMNVYYKHI